MTDNKYLEKVAARQRVSIKGLLEQQIEDAYRSRVPVKSHKIQSEEDRKRSRRHAGAPRPRMQKRSIMEKRAALPSISRTMKFAAGATGAPQTKPKLPKADTSFSVPKPISQKVSNPNKPILKKAAVAHKVKNILKGTSGFAANVAAGTAKSGKDSAKAILGHAGGKSLREYAKKNIATTKKLGGKTQVEGFMRLSDAQKKAVVKSKKSAEKLKEFNTLKGKRDASRLAVGVASVGGVVGGKKVHDKAKTMKAEHQRRKLQRLYNRHYGQ